MEDHARNVNKSTGIVAINAIPDKKRLRNKTWLTCIQPISPATPDEMPVYQLQIFGNPIIQYNFDKLILNDHGWFSKTTHERFREYMPRGFSVFAYSIHIRNLSPRIVAFIKTPVGVYPYKMPMEFTYAGYSLLEDGPANNASTAVTEIPRYLDNYFTRLFNGGPWTIGDKPLTRSWLEEGTWQKQSMRMQTALLEDIYFKDFASIFVEFAQGVGAQGLSIQEIVDLVLSEGIQVFKKPRTDTQMSNNTEASIMHKLPIPTISKTWIRSELKQRMYPMILDALGFDEVTWNRR